MTIDHVTNFTLLFSDKISTMIKNAVSFFLFPDDKMTMYTPNTGKYSYNDIMPDLNAQRDRIMTLRLRLERHS